MPCNLYNNNGCGCGGCIHFVKTNSVTLVDNVLILNIPQATYSNKEKVCICIAQTIPDITSADTVAVTIGAGTTQYVLRNRIGNNVHADQIRSRRKKATPQIYKHSQKAYSGTPDRSDTVYPKGME